MMCNSRFFALLLVSILTVSLAVLAAQDKRPVTIDDYFAIKNVGSPRISPGGDWVAYTVRTTDFEKDKSETGIWMMPYEGGEPIRMTGAGSPASQPRWSPDGKYLSFLASRGEKAKTQVWVLNRQGGEAQQLTELKRGVGSHSWSPDSKRLLLSIRDPEEGEEEDGEDEDAKPKKDKPKPWVIDRLQFKRDNVGYLDRRRTHYYVYEIESKELRQITSGDYDDGQGVWSPDGKRVAFVSNRTDEPDGNSNSDIWIVSADNTDKGQTLKQVTDNPGSDGSPAWSPDGKRLAYNTGLEPEIIWYATTHLAVIDLDGGEPQILSRELDRNCYGPEFAPDGSGIYCTLEDSAEWHLAKFDASSGAMSRPIQGQHTLRLGHLDGQGRMALVMSNPTLPGAVFLHDGEGTRQLTESNAELLAKLQLSEPRNITFSSADGTEIEGFVFPPIGFDESLRYPTLLRIHGGPVSQYSFGFNFEAQLFAAQGYLVVQSNPRGSSGYGQDFSLAIWRDWGNKDFQDVMAAVDYAVEQGWADPERLGVGGWSYGGILTNYVITQTGRFEAAITGASEVLYISNYGHDHYQLQWEKELGLPWENREAWERISPFNKVTEITTPTLIMGGEHDWNVPILNSEQLYQALKRLGRDTQLVVYPNQHHGIRLPTFIKDRWQRYLAWYDKYVKGQVTETQ